MDIYDFARNKYEWTLEYTNFFGNSSSFENVTKQRQTNETLEDISLYNKIIPKKIIRKCRF